MKKTSALEKIKGTLLIVAFLVLTPIIIPFAIITTQLDKWKLRRAARSASCKKCGATLGLESLAIADKYWCDQFAVQQKKFPGVKFRRVKTFCAICPACGTRHAFFKKTDEFKIVEENLKREF